MASTIECGTVTKPVDGGGGEGGPKVTECGTVTKPVDGGNGDGGGNGGGGGNGNGGGNGGDGNGGGPMGVPRWLKILLGAGGGAAAGWIAV